MSFLAMPNASINMAKATVSLWFRFPASTIKRVNANPPPRGGAYGYSEAATWPVLQWQLTLLSWGNQIPGMIWSDTQQKVGETYNAAGVKVSDNFAPQPTLTQTGPMAPSYIGLHFVGDDDVRIVVNLQGSKSPSIQNIQFMMTRWDVLFVGDPGVSGYTETTIVNTDRSFTMEHPMTVGAHTGGNSNTPNPMPSIKADAWHHLLISWDVTGSISCGGDSLVISSGFKMYFALDDTNHDKSALPADWIGDIGLEPGAAGTDPNTIVSNDAVLNRLPWPADPGREEFAYHSNATPAGSYSGTIAGLPGNNMFVPGSPSYTDGGRTVNSIYQVEMAELQIFSGVTLDTSKMTNRRAFVDKDGTPVDPTGTEDDPAPAVKLLGKKPDVLLHGSSNWKTGYNTGTLGIKIETDGTITNLPNGQFKPTGGIEPYKPEPQLSEDSTA